MLADLVADAALRRDGYVVLDEPILTSSEAVALREAFGRIHGWEGAGFLNDFNHRNRGYRRRTDEVLRRDLWPAVQGRFTSYEPFLSTFLCKWPDEQSTFVPHRDWMYVDEGGGRSTYLAFVALEPIGAQNGRVRMLRGSHRFDPMLRGSNLYAPWLQYVDLLDRHLEDIDLGMGQCIVWNSAIVHASLPNRSAEPRVAAGLWVRDRDDPLVHYARLDESTAARYPVDLDFYRTQNPYRLMVSRPPYRAEARVETGESTVDREALATALDALRAQRGALDARRSARSAPG